MLPRARREKDKVKAKEEEKVEEEKEERLNALKNMTGEEEMGSGLYVL
jgi:hypothetical protein